MQLGMIGLGRMGANMVRRLLRAGHEGVVFDMSPKAVEELVLEKAVGGASPADFVSKPFVNTDLELPFANALKQRQLSRETAANWRGSVDMVTLPYVRRPA